MPSPFAIIFPFFYQTRLTKSRNFAIVPKRCKMVFYALVAQLAEHIHGKDKVTSSILVEGWVFTIGKTVCKPAALRLSGRGLGFA